MTTVSNRERWYTSGMGSAPAMSAIAGSLIAILDAVLVNGWDSRVINSLVVSGGIATATISGGHVYEVGTVIRVAGVTPATLNGDWRLAEVTGSTAVWSVAGLGIADGTATGTMTALRAPAGWDKVFSASGKAVYRALDPLGSRLYLRVDDTGTTTARIRGYETMSDIDTGTGLFPTDVQVSGGLYVGKANSGTGTRKWAVSADSRRLTFLTAYHSSYPDDYGHWVFGDPAGTAPGDVFPAIIYGVPTAAGAISSSVGSFSGDLGGNLLRTATGVTGLFAARAANGVGGSVQQIPGWVNAAIRSGAGAAGPDAAGAWWLQPIVILGGTTLSAVPRGYWPCLCYAVQSLPYASDTSLTKLGERYRAMQYGGDQSSSRGIYAVDVLGPWS